MSLTSGLPGPIEKTDDNLCMTEGSILQPRLCINVQFFLRIIGSRL